MYNMYMYMHMCASHAEHAHAHPHVHPTPNSRTGVVTHVKQRLIIQARTRSQPGACPSILTSSDTEPSLVRLEPEEM